MDANHKLAKLQEALDAGILSASEFEQKRAQLIQPQQTNNDSLMQLQGLFEAGIINQTEYEAKAAEIQRQSAKLAKLQEALEAGIISEPEYQQKRAEVMGTAVPFGKRIGQVDPESLEVKGRLGMLEDAGGSLPSKVTGIVEEKAAQVLDRPASGGGPSKGAQHSETADFNQGSGRESKECPFCAERVSVLAKKCKHCGSSKDSVL